MKNTVVNHNENFKLIKLFFLFSYLKLIHKKSVWILLNQTRIKYQYYLQLEPDCER